MSSREELSTIRHNTDGPEQVSSLTGTPSIRIVYGTYRISYIEHTMLIYPTLNKFFVIIIIIVIVVHWWHVISFNGNFSLTLVTTSLLNFQWLSSGSFQIVVLQSSASLQNLSQFLALLLSLWRLLVVLLMPQWLWGLLLLSYLIVSGVLSLNPIIIIINIIIIFKE